MIAKAVFMTGVRQIKIEPVEVDLPGPDQVLVHTLYSAISHGTEMAFYRGTAPFLDRAWDEKTRLFSQSATPEISYPFRYGYSNVSKVVECGVKVTTLKPGDIVFSGSPHQTDFVENTRDLVLLPDGVDPKLGVFLLIIRTTLNGILDAGICLGETVVIFGQGVLGQILAQMARLSGAGQVIVADPLPGRREISLRCGADAALNPLEEDVAAQVRGLTNGRGADVVIEVSGAFPALQEAIRTVVPRGKVVALGFYQGDGKLNLSSEFHHNWINIQCSQGGSINPALSHRWNSQRLMDTATSLLVKLDLAPLVTNVMDFEDAAKAYALIDQHPDKILQVLLKYS